MSDSVRGPERGHLEGRPRLFRYARARRAEPLRFLGAFVEAWNEHFDASGPTRTTVAVHPLPDPRLAVELEAIASFE